MKLTLTKQIFIALVLGIFVGYIFPDFSTHLKVFGDIFIRMIKMIIIPLVFTTLIVGIAGTGNFKKLGKLGGKSIIWFEVASLLALIIGLVVVNLLHPGTGVNLNTNENHVYNTAEKHLDIVAFLVNIVPSNIMQACADGDILQIIFFSCFFGVALAHLGDKGQNIVNLAQNVAEAMFKVTQYIMYYAPIGVFAMIAYAVGNFGLSMMIPLGKLVFSLYFAIFVFLLILLCITSFIAKANLFCIIKALWQPLLLGYSTAASEAALPLLMQKLHALKIPKPIITFVIPTGYSFNLDGSTLYTSLAVIFLAQMYQIELSLSQQIIMLLVLMVSTKGIAGVPGASIVVITATAASFGIPTEGIAIILSVDRIMDMARTFCNILGNSIATIIVALWEKEISGKEIQDACKA